MLSDANRKELLKLARNTMELYITKGIVLKFESAEPQLTQEAGAFVTLHNKNRLRGCIGLIEGRQKLYETVIEMAIELARHDPRFEPVSGHELKDIDIEVSVLYPKKKVKSADDIEIGKHGVIVKKGFATGVFLPQVAAETGWSKDEFMRHLCADKAGLAPDAYKNKDTEIYVFEAEVFGEK